MAVPDSTSTHSDGSPTLLIVNGIPVCIRSSLTTVNPNGIPVIHRPGGLPVGGSLVPYYLGVITVDRIVYDVPPATISSTCFGALNPVNVEGSKIVIEVNALAS